MLELYLGAFFLCALIVTLSLCAIQIISIKIGNKTYEDEIIYIGDYIQSIIIFLVISAFLLLLYVHYYFIYASENALYNSGLLFLLLSCATGFISKLIYKFVLKAINWLSKANSTYYLKNHEINWLWIFILSSYCIAFLCFKSYSYSFSYLTLILSYFFWLDSNIKARLKELTSLSVAYWCCLILVIICIFISIRYQDFLSIAAILGTIVGFFIGIFCMYNINKYFKKQNKTEKQVSKRYHVPYQKPESSLSMRLPGSLFVIAELIFSICRF